MKKFLLAAALFWPAFACAQTLPCHPDQISVVDSSGHYIRMTSGQVFQVYPGQNTTAVFWNPLDRVQVCVKGGSAYEIINTNSKNTKVAALRKFN